MSVKGPVDPSELGVTLTHEHLFIDTRSSYALSPQTDEEEALARKPVSIELLGKARRNIGAVPDALVLDDYDLIIKELGDFTRLGGKTIVDVTPRGIYATTHETRAEALHRLSVESGLNIVIGCGYYVKATHPPNVANQSVSEIEHDLLCEINYGLDGGPVHPGVIGEIGISQPSHPDEWKVLSAACLVQKQTGLPLYIHPFFGARSRIAPEVAKFVLHEGVDPQRVNMCHMDSYMNIAYQRRVADMGVWISFDNFGIEIYYDSLDFNHNCHDSQREDFLIELLDLGYQDQILISQDVCTKLQLHRYGGFGYSHILSNILPSLRHAGVDNQTIQRLLVENPRRYLSIA